MHAGDRSDSLVAVAKLGIVVGICPDRVEELLGRP